MCLQFGGRGFAADIELLKNGGFDEFNFEGWELALGSDVGKPIATQEAFFGGAGGALKFVNDQHKNLILHQDVSLNKETSVIIISGMIKVKKWSQGKKFGTGAMIGFQVYDAAGERLWPEEETKPVGIPMETQGDLDWTRVETRLVVPMGAARLRVILYVRSLMDSKPPLADGGIVYFDEVSAVLK